MLDCNSRNFGSAREILAFCRSPVSSEVNRAGTCFRYQSHRQTMRCLLQRILSKSPSTGETYQPWCPVAASKTRLSRVLPGAGSLFALAHTCACSPIFAQSSFAAHALSSAAANDLTVGASARKPVSGSSSHSVMSPISVPIVGRPQIIASTKASGALPTLDRNTSRWFSAQMERTSVMCPRKSTRSWIPK